MAFLVLAFAQSLIATIVDSRSEERPKADEAPG
jgi:hypothetical protein